MNPNFTAFYYEPRYMNEYNSYPENLVWNRDFVDSKSVDTESAEQNPLLPNPTNRNLRNFSQSSGTTQWCWVNGTYTLC